MTPKKIIGLKGLSGAGKDTIANFLVKYYNFTKVSFAGPLKSIVSIITGWPLDMIMGETKESREFRETVKHPLFGFTTRELMQKIGTDLFRQHFDKDIWVKICKQSIQAIPGDVVVSDVRFPNEATMIQELKGTIWNVQRQQQRSGTTTPSSTHASEQLFETSNEIKISNDKNVEELYALIRGMLE